MKPIDWVFVKDDLDQLDLSATIARKLDEDDAPAPNKRYRLRLDVMPDDLFEPSDVQLICEAIESGCKQIADAFVSVCTVAQTGPPPGGVDPQQERHLEEWRRRSPE